MKAGNSIEVRDLTKKFKVYFDKGSSLKEKILFKNRNRYEDRTVLNGISFDVKRGEAIGLIGHNGSGKSTTLKLLSRIIYPDSGSIEMEGRVSSLIELGAGFHPDMSGRENIYTNASIFGLSKKEIDQRVESIIEFTELEEFIDNPVRTYSSGMYMRLAFSVAINVDADILLIDEILAVGDVYFQEKCFNRLREIKRQGTTIVIVSHSLGQIEEICEKTIWIDQGKIALEGIPFDVHPKYMEYMQVEKKIDKVEEKRLEKEKETEKAKNTFQNEDASISKITYVNEKGDSTALFQAGDAGRLEIEYKVGKFIDNAVFGMDLKRDHWIRCYGTNIRDMDVPEFSMDIKESDYLFYLSKINDSVDNLTDKMAINGQCDRIDDAIVIHNGGTMWGPYMKVSPIEYKLIIDAAFDESVSAVIRVTGESGSLEICDFKLESGTNKFKLSFDKVVNNLEFVIHSDNEKDITIKQIKLA